MKLEQFWAEQPEAAIAFSGGVDSAYLLYSAGVIFWSTSNEEPLHIHDVGCRIHRAIAAHIRKLDNTRFILAAQDKTPDKSTIFEYSDIIGINYNLPLYDEVHQMIPGKAILASECGAAGTSRDWCLSGNSNGRVQESDKDGNDWFWGHERTWKFLQERPYVIGAYQWDAVEHRGEANWPRVCSLSGSIDLFLQKKSGFYQNKSHWTKAPMVHIVPHWNFSGLENEEILVTVYTNCEELELFLNGVSLGKKQIEKYGRGEWLVAYLPGKLTVVGFQDGIPVCNHTRITTGKPVRLKLSLDNSFEANGRDLALFTCECLDKNGNVVPNASPFVYFSAGFPAQIVGTGSDNCDHNPVGLAERKMYMGKISIAVRPEKGQTQLELLAQSDYLDACLLKLPLHRKEEVENDSL